MFLSTYDANGVARVHLYFNPCPSHTLSLCKVHSSIADLHFDIKGITSGLYKRQFSEDMDTTSSWLAAIVARANAVLVEVPLFSHSKFDFLRVRLAQIRACTNLSENAISHFSLKIFFHTLVAKFCCTLRLPNDVSHLRCLRGK